jgi:hypothetical protein
LWNKVDEYQRQEDWISMSPTLRQLTILQTYYVKVWTYQAWNVSYNIAAKWDDYRDKYFWVIGGFKLLARGMEFNELEPQLPYDLGWTISHRIGQADERRDFRILFARDDDFHRLPWARWVNERDNWLFGKKYLEFAQELVDRRGAVLRSVGAELFNEQPAISQSQYAHTIEIEGTFGDKARRAWQQATAEWKKLGEREFPTDHGFTIRYVDLTANQERLAELTKQFDALTPGLRERLLLERRAALPEDQRRAYDTPKDARTATETRLAYRAEAALSVNEAAIAEAADTARRDEARRLAAEISLFRQKVQSIKNSRDIFNYDYWVARSDMETTEDALAARQLFYRAVSEADEKPWDAKKTFEEGFRLWRKIVDKYPDMINDQTSFEVYDLIRSYLRVLQQLDEPFDRAKFILRDLMEENEQTGT